MTARSRTRYFSAVPDTVWALSWLLLLFLLCTPLALAEESDYLPDSVAWNGLSQWSDLARGMKLQLVLREELSWEQLAPGETLLIVYPRVKVAATELAAFIRQGGRVLVADDFGEAGELLRELGILRLDGSSLRASRYHDDNQNLPVAMDGPTRHPLNAGVREVITNHPAFFISRYSTLLGFGQGREQLLVSGTVGQGVFVALSDPSVLLNAMLHFPGNRQLATNVLHQLAPKKGTQLNLLTGHFRISGHFASSAPPSSASGSTQQFLREYNDFLGRLNDFALTRDATTAMAFVCSSLAIMGFVLLFPRARKDVNGHWLRPENGLEPRKQPRRAAHHAALIQPRGHERPAIHTAIVLLRDELEEILTDVLQAPGPLLSMKSSWILARVAQRGGKTAQATCARLLTLLTQLPQSAAASRWPLRQRAAERTLVSLYDQGHTLLVQLDSPQARHLPLPTRDHVHH